MLALPFFMQQLIEHLSKFILPRRVDLFDKILDFRTQYITIALEDIYQAQNASAVLRSCDCLGIQDVHIIEDRNDFQPDREVALGSSKWLNLIRYKQYPEPTMAAIENLRSQGYRIIATTPHSDDVDLENIDLKKGKMALFFGTELKGLSSTLLDNADEFVKIPMMGFTESFNISVSAAIILHHLTYKLRNSEIPWELDSESKMEIKLSWLRTSIKSSKMLEEEYRRSR